MCFRFDFRRSRRSPRKRSTRSPRGPCWNEASGQLEPCVKILAISDRSSVADTPPLFPLILWISSHHSWSLRHSSTSSSNRFPGVAPFTIISYVLSSPEASQKTSISASIRNFSNKDFTRPRSSSTSDSYSTNTATRNLYALFQLGTVLRITPSCRINVS